MVDCVLLGSSGALGASVAARLLEENIQFLTVTRNPQHTGEKIIFWDYKSRVPKEITSAKLVINCARGQNFSENINVAKNLIRQIEPLSRLVLIGSNCIYARPCGRIATFFFSGDAYIREKKIIEQLAKSRSNVHILRPTIVTGEGAWTRFLESAGRAENVYVPSGATSSVVKTITRAEVAELVFEVAFKSSAKDKKSDELYTRQLKLEEFLGRPLEATLSNNSFEESWLKNLITIIFCSWLLPFRVKAMLQQQLMGRSGGSDNLFKHDLKMSGMTRLYLCGAHTKK